MPYILSAALKNVKVTPASKFLVFSGPNGDQVLVSSAPSAPQIQEMQTKVGNTAKAVETGLCFRDEAENYLIFGTKAEPKSTTSKSIKNAMAAGNCVCKFEVRKLEGDEEKQGSESSSEESSSEEGKGKLPKVTPKQGVEQKKMFGAARQANPRIAQGGTGQPNLQGPPNVQQGANNPLGQPKPPVTTANPQVRTNQPTPVRAVNKPGPVRPTVNPVKPQANPNQPIPVIAEPGVKPIRVKDVPEGAIPINVVNKSGPVKPAVLRPAPIKKANLPAQRPVVQKPAYVGQKDPEGIEKLKTRELANLDPVKKLASETAKIAFQPGGGAKCAKVFTGQPVNRNALTKLTTDLDGFYASWVADATTEGQKKDRPETVKREKEMAKALDDAFQKYEASGSAWDLNSLQVACKDAKDLYERRLGRDLAAIAGQIKTAQDQIEAAKKAIKAAQGKPKEGEEPMTKDQIKALIDEKKQIITNKESKIAFENQKRQELLSGPQSARVAASADALLEVRLIKNASLVKQLGDKVTATENDKSEKNVEQVCKDAALFVSMCHAHAATYRTLDRKQPPEVLEKMVLANRLLDEAETTLFSLKQERLGPPPWPDADKQREGNDLVDLSRQIAAKEAIRHGKKGKQKSGASDVQVILDSKEKVQFAFKTADGENEKQTQMPKGSGAIREAVTSKVMDSILEQTGFDFGFPKATLATIGGKQGALIEGINGRELPDADEVKKLSDKEKNEIADFQNAIPGKQLQKTVCAGFLTGNFLDMKWDNVFIEGEGKKANARPFDAGAGFLKTDRLKEDLKKNDPPGFDVPLLFDANLNPTKGAQEPMDDTIIDAMLKIDLRAMEQTIEDEIRRAGRLGTLIDPEAQQNGLKSLRAAKTVLMGYKDAAQRKQPMPDLIQFAKDMEAAIIALYP
jgi:hypothetical protein